MRDSFAINRVLVVDRSWDWCILRFVSVETRERIDFFQDLLLINNLIKLQINFCIVRLSGVIKRESEKPNLLEERC